MGLDSRACVFYGPTAVGNASGEQRCGGGHWRKLLPVVVVETQQWPARGSALADRRAAVRRALSRGG
eukprot:9306521-Lingulodinium_polyedra.AAC.1